jgi:hypothetical protein
MGNQRSRVDKYDFPLLHWKLGDVLRIDPDMAFVGFEIARNDVKEGGLS